MSIQLFCMCDWMRRDPAVDVAALKENGGNVLIGTPGRLDDVMKRCPFLEFKSLEVRKSRTGWCWETLRQ
jgi:superfamily II DNA/RNA helicase